jgi:molybdate transport system regulatory protein
MARLRVSIVFESGARIGPGKAKLLESIRDTGSISAAAREMGMSYKRAWLLLDSMNQAFTELVVTAAPGGAGGGGATLTPFGAEVLERYRLIHDGCPQNPGTGRLKTFAGGPAARPRSRCSKKDQPSRCGSGPVSSAARHGANCDIKGVNYAENAKFR